MSTPVLLVSNFLSASGGSRGVCEELADRLTAAGSCVLTTSDKPAKLQRLADMLACVFKHRHRYAVAQVDIFSGAAFIWAELACAALRFCGKPYILSLHGGDLPNFSKRNKRRVKRLFNTARAITTPSRYLHATMAPYRSDLLLLPNAIDLGRYLYRKRESAQPSLVWLRSFHRIYNPLLAPRVLELLVQHFPRAALTMVGPDKKDGSLQRVTDMAVQFQLQDRLSLPGGVPKTEVPEWLNRGDIFLNTTNVDNAPVSVLEAMACGLCVVSTNVGGLPYLLKHEHDALLVSPDDPSAMAHAVRRVLEDDALAGRLSYNARRKAQEHDWSVILPEWQRLIGQVAKINHRQN